MWQYILIGILAGIVVALTIALIVVASKKKKLNESIDKANSENKADDVRFVDGVRYTESKKELDEKGNVKVTHTEGDVILKRGITYKVEKMGTVIPGKYTVLSASESDDKFNIRIGDFVREYSHRDNIVLAEGQEITSVSHDIILR